MFRPNICSAKNKKFCQKKRPKNSSIEKKWDQKFYPFVRLQYYDGGKKHELDARSYTVKDTEIGIEWHPLPHFEFLVEYTFSDRRYEDFENPINHQKGRLMRVQVQLKF